METLTDVRYSPESEWLVINHWVFQNTYPNDVSFICSRSSGVNDYIAEWWYINGKYQLKWKAYHESDVDVRCDGTLIKEVDTVHDVLLYCSTHLHPDL